MEENNKTKGTREISEHIKAISNWADQGDNRTAFIVCGELDSDGVATASSLMGRNDKVALTMYNMAKENENFARVVKLAGRMLDNELIAAYILQSVTEDNAENTASNFLVDLLTKMVDKIKGDK